MGFIIENLGKIGFEWKMALFNLINFLILFLILKKLFFKPILKVIREREDKVAESVDNFKKAKTELQMAEQKARQIIDDSKKEANEILQNNYVQVMKNTEDMKNKAKDEVEQLILQAKNNIKLQKEAMVENLKGETAELVSYALEKILNEKIDEKKDKKLIVEALKNI